MSEYRAGQVWDTNSRKGALTILLHTDVDISVDDFFEALIVEGRARYLSASNNAAQKYYGLGTPGDTVSFRTTLTTFLRRREDVEAAIAEKQEQWAKP